MIKFWTVLWCMWWRITHKSTRAVIGATEEWSPMEEVRNVEEVRQEVEPDWEVRTWHVDFSGEMSQLMEDVWHDLEMVCGWAIRTLDVEPSERIKLLRWGQSSVEDTGVMEAVR